MTITVSVNNLPELERLRTDMQRYRVAFGNRAGAIEREASQLDPQLIELFESRFQALEDEAAGFISSCIRDHEMWPWLDAVKGIGPGLAGALVAPIDITRANSVSALWRYAGQGVNGDGQRDKPTKGEKLPYNATLKKNCYLVGTSFMRASSPYRREYDEAKEYYQRNRADWTPKHIDMASKRKMVKLFLSHLWLVWRDMRRLPVRAPYAMQVMGHDGIKHPWEYVPDYDYPTSLKS
jgi:hypothetical protein